MNVTWPAELLSIYKGQQAICGLHYNLAIPGLQVKYSILPFHKNCKTFVGVKSTLMSGAIMEF